ncbi:MAG TPA: YbhB/YbcL family Raf kinase inhibitor-like protein [Variovorax sp.]|jgi:hypothetical protein
MKTRQHFFTALFGAACMAGAGMANAAPMQVTSASFADGTAIPLANAGNAPGCGGQGISPQVAWSGLPEGAQSVAVLISDPDGGKGAGVSHLVAYNIAAARMQMKEGELGADGPGVTVGKNSAGANAYRGMCPPNGDRPHHYILTVIATDVQPGTLAGGMTRDELMAALKGHTLGSQSVVGLYSR